ncbi:uncharacterized protein LOC123005781 [Tribolium madens]|uniref:uncharacterized protein LOC123005781 n=1 Tax=Tribolium madens TaxID=41895 RepID=UPI001CF75526|nr:uncharacterized protein LOC123005781 [Tribolium madens]
MKLFTYSCYRQPEFISHTLRNLTRKRTPADACERLEMRDNLNINVLPIVQDNMNYTPKMSLTNLSSNGYYGYQPPLEKQKKEDTCFMEVQFESPPNRKRAWEFGTDLREFKKRRQNDCSPFVYQQSTIRTDANTLRKPTHNIPDMPRCIMGHFI